MINEITDMYKFKDQKEKNLPKVFLFLIEDFL